MKKRTFLKLSGAAGAQSMFMPWLAWGKRVPDKLRNWAGNIEYGTDNPFAAK